MSKLLSISIPTFNRSQYILELLESVLLQIKSNPRLRDLIEIYVFDNASTDDTHSKILPYLAEVTYIRNKTNIGMDENIKQAYLKPVSDYVWVIGDDELLPTGSLEIIVNCLCEKQPALIINLSKEYKTFCDVASEFDSYDDFVRFSMENNPHLLIAHSLISANVVCKTLLSEDIYEKYSYSTYAFFYCFIGEALNRGGAIVTFQSSSTLIVREARAPIRKYTDESMAESVEEMQEIIDAVENMQVDYLQWLKEKCALGRLAPDKVVMRYQSKISPSKSVFGEIYRFIYINIETTRPFLKWLKLLLRR